MEQKMKETNVVLLATMIVALISGDIYFILNHFFGNIFPFLSLLGVRLVFGQCMLILPTIVYLYIKKIDWKETLSFRRIKWSSAFKLVILAYLLVPILACINGISLIFTENQVAKTLSNMSMQGPLLLSIFIIAFIPCLVEESIFRGLLYGRYKEIGFKKGLLLSGFLFGLMHFNLNQFCYAFVMGIIFALLLEGTGSILAPIIVHFTINSNSIIMQYIQSSIVQKTQEKVIETTNVAGNTIYSSILFFGIVSIFTGILAYFIFISIIKKEERIGHMKQLSKKKIKKEHSIQTMLPLIISILLGSIYIIIQSLQ